MALMNPDHLHPKTRGQTNNPQAPTNESNTTNQKRTHIVGKLHFLFNWLLSLQPDQICMYIFFPVITLYVILVRVIHDDSVDV